MAGWDMKVNGLGDLQAALQDLSKNQSARILNKALGEGCEIFKEEEQALCPERPDLPSSTALPPGALRQDIDIKHRRGARALWTIGPGFYGKQAHLVEFGHRLVKGGKNKLMAHGIQVGPGTVIGFVPPHPYMRPAYEGKVAEAIDFIRQVVADELAKLRYKASRKAS